jgi:hypothetical protein
VGMRRNGRRLVRVYRRTADQQAEPDGSEE